MSEFDTTKCTPLLLGADAYIPAGATTTTPTCPTCCSHDHTSVGAGTTSEDVAQRTEVDTTKWQAFLSDDSGFVHEDPDEALREIFKDDLDGRITVCRGSALPHDRDGGLRLDGTYTSSDIFIEIDLSDIEEYEQAVEVWELAQRAAWGMNQSSGVVDRAAAAAEADPNSYGRDGRIVAELREAAKRIRDGAPVDPAHVAVWLECVAIDEKTEPESGPRFKERFNAIQLARVVNATAQASVAEEQPA